MNLPDPKEQQPSQAQAPGSSRIDWRQWLGKLGWLRHLPWKPVAIALGVLVGLLLVYAVLNRGDATVGPSAEQPLSLPAGVAGKAGQVVVTEEALELAEIRTAPAEVRMVHEKLKVTGVIETGGDQFARVTPRGSGKITRLLAAPGDDVSAGQTLALLESLELAQGQAAYSQAAARLQALESNLTSQRELASLGQFGRPQVEQARLRAVEAELDVREAEQHLSEEKTLSSEAESELRVSSNVVSQAQTELEVQRSRLERAESLKEIVAGQELERIRANFTNAQAEVEVSRAKVSQARARIQGARERVAAAQSELELERKRLGIGRAALGRAEKVFSGRYLTSRELLDAEAAFRMAQVELEGAAESVRLLGGEPGQGNEIPLTSPIAGKVQECSITLGETVHPEQAAFTVLNLDRVWARLAVAPKDIQKVNPGDEVELVADSFPGRVFRGRVTHVSAAADETTRVVHVRTTFDNPDGALKAGAFVTGSVITDIRHERLAVPDGTLQEHTGRATLYVAQPGRPGAFEVRHVTLGARGQGWREVSEGLKPGEPVAVSGTFYLKSEALKSSLSDGCCAVGK